MQNNVMKLVINLSKVDKQKLFKGQKGIYLNAALIIKDDADQFGNHALIVEEISKEQRMAGERGTIIGSGKYIQPQTLPGEINGNVLDDLPF
jgi:hypothetical protein